MDGVTEPETAEVGVGDKSVEEVNVAKRTRRQTKMGKEAVQWVVSAVEELGEARGSAAPDVAKWLRANAGPALPEESAEGAVLLALRRAVQQGLLDRAPGGRFVVARSALVPTTAGGSCFGCPKGKRSGKKKAVVGKRSGGKRSKSRKKSAKRASGKRGKSCGPSRRKGHSKSRGRNRSKSRGKHHAKKQAKPKSRGRSRGRRGRSKSHGGSKGGGKGHHCCGGGKGGKGGKGDKGGKRSKSRGRHGGSKKPKSVHRAHPRKASKGRSGGGKVRSRSKSPKAKAKGEKHNKSNRCPKCRALYQRHLKQGEKLLCNHCLKRRIKDREYQKNRRSGGHGRKCASSEEEISENDNQTK